MAQAQAGRGHRPIKIEPGTFPPLCQAKRSAASIDLDSPSPKRHASDQVSSDGTAVTQVVAVTGAAVQSTADLRAAMLQSRLTACIPTGSGVSTTAPTPPVVVPKVELGPAPGHGSSTDASIKSFTTNKKRLDAFTAKLKTAPPALKAIWDNTISKLKREDTVRVDWVSRMASVRGNQYDEAFSTLKSKSIETTRGHGVDGGWISWEKFKDEVGETVALAKIKCKVVHLKLDPDCKGVTGHGLKFPETHLFKHATETFHEGTLTR